MTAETTLPHRASDPSYTVGDSTVVTPFSGEIPVVGHASFSHVPGQARDMVSRRIRRLTQTREIRIRTTHRRRKMVTRGGVLAGFALAMVVYPVMGNVVAVTSAVANVPGVILGESPTTGHALLGDGPQLIPTVVEMPSVDDQVQALAVARSNAPYVLSELLPDCMPPASFTITDNGHLPDSELCSIWGGNVLRADAALAAAQLNEQFKAAFGRDLCILEGYRSYADQVRIKGLRGYMAASPGTSMHGFGLAFDLCSGDDGGTPKAWLDKNAGAFGFVNPDWAKFRKYEPWHWEYAPGVDATGHYGNSDWASGYFDESEQSVDSSTTTGQSDTAPVAPAGTDESAKSDPAPSPAPAP